MSSEVKVGIGLPTTIPGVQRGQVLDWARGADAAGFSTLGTLDRLIYPNLEPLVSLGAAAAVTERIGLMTAVLLLPLRRNAAVVAKQAATVQMLSEGRLTLGVGLGSREEDYTASGLSTKARGKRANEMLAQIRRLWAGEEVGYAGGVGPDVRDNPPQIIVGGTSDEAFRRVAEYADGWMLGGGAPERFPELAGKLEAVWRERGRQGEPRKLALTYFALGDDPEGDARRSIGDYYSFSPEYAEAVVAATAKGEEGVRERLDYLRKVGVDEVVMFPASPDPEQVDLLAAIAL
jgi:alkanesulfonate monooxygenase SsuD/methylene tetrahydromethanopterin reductase-like flavin-dependent oxidoreductase (luciferase family)